MSGSLIPFVDHHLGEGDLHAVVVEEDLQIPCQHSLSGKNVLLLYIHGEFQVDAAVRQGVHAQIPGRAEVELRVLLLQIAQLFLQ